MLGLAALLLLAYGLIAYLALPFAWRHYEHERGLETIPMVTRTAQGIPGDPLNVGLVGDREDLVKAMHAAGWYPSDPITLRTSLEIVGSVLLDRPYRDAPVSNLFLLGRKEDLAFEKPDGRSADRRHHVRFWQVLQAGEDGRPVWLGSATFDRGVGVSHYTGAVTHHIAPDIDAERDFLMASLTDARMLAAVFTVTGVGPTLNGRNGGGDPYFTDGEVHMGRLVRDGAPSTTTPEELPSPLLTQFQVGVWNQVLNVLAR